MNAKQMRNRSLHDAEFLSIAVDRKNAVGQFDFRLADSTLCTVRLIGLRALRVEDMIIQNVVSRVLRSSQRQFTVEDLAFWVRWATSLSDASSWLKEQRYSDWMAALNGGTLELVVFEPSAGAQVAAVCERLEELEQSSK